MLCIYYAPNARIYVVQRLPGGGKKTVEITTLSVVGMNQAWLRIPVYNKKKSQRTDIIWRTIRWSIHAYYRNK